MILRKILVRWFNKKSKSSPIQLPNPVLQDFLTHNGYGHTPIWFEFECGNRIDLNSNIIIEDPRGLYHFLRSSGQQLIAQQSKHGNLTSQRLSIPIIFYEKDYRKFRL